MSLKQKLAYLKRHFQPLPIVLIGLILFLASILYFCLKLNLNQAKAMESILEQINIPQPERKINLLKQPLTILILGLDSRKGDQKPRCDAIHLMTFSPPEEKIVITSVPRGTAVDLGEEIATPSAYLGNSCHIKSIDWAVEEIKRITQLQPDFVIKVNFSQVLGGLRLLKIPTTPTLQFLRDRKSYYWGDNQRSHNQALFIKDIILKHTQQVAGLPKLAKQLAFKIVDSNGLGFETAESILNWVVKNKLDQKPDQIELIIKPTPSFQIKDVHFEDSKFASESAWQNDEGFQDYQSELQAYLKNLVNQAEKSLKAEKKESAFNLLKTPFWQQLWLQIENEQKRNQLHFDLVKVYVQSSEDKAEAKNILEDFINQMSMAQNEELKNQAEELKQNL